MDSIAFLFYFKVLLEAQFDRNMKFKGHVNGLTADELRSKPLGKDIFGNYYWCIMDRHYSIKIFRENIDDETWNLVARYVLNTTKRIPISMQYFNICEMIFC